MADRTELQRELDSLQTEFDRLKSEHSQLVKTPKDVQAHEAHRRKLNELIGRLQKVREEIGRV